MKNKDIDKLEELLNVIDPNSEVLKKTKEEIKKIKES